MPPTRRHECGYCGRPGRPPGERAPDNRHRRRPALASDSHSALGGEHGIHPGHGSHHIRSRGDVRGREGVVRGVGGQAHGPALDRHPGPQQPGSVRHRRLLRLLRVGDGELGVAGDAGLRRQDGRRFGRTDGLPRPGCGAGQDVDLVLWTTGEAAPDGRRLSGMTPPPPYSVLRTPTELLAMWEGLMGAGGFSVRSVWLVFFDDQFRMQPVIVPIDDLPAEPDPQLIENLVGVVRGLVDNEAASTVALLISRDGPTGMTESDRRWARAFRAAFDSAIAPWPLHLATRDQVRIFAPDDLIA